MFYCVVMENLIEKFYATITTNDSEYDCRQDVTHESTHTKLFEV